MSEQTPFEKRAKEVLEESAGRLDGRTRSRLTQARHAALARLEQPQRLGWRTYVPVGAAAGAAVLAVVIYTGKHNTDPATVVENASAVEDMELLADADAPDFVDDGDDLEFYEWAAGEQES
jgi:hypothetical protein